MVVVSTLGILSTRVITDNLHLLSRICRENSIIIPSLIGTQIFEFANSFDEPFTVNELNFFTNDIVSLSSVSLKGAKYGKAKDLAFLTNHPIKSLTLYAFSSIFNLPTLYTLEHLHLKYCNLQDFEYLSLGEQLLDCPHLKSLTFEKITNAGIIFKVNLSEPKASLNSLSSISITRCDLTEEEGFIIGEFLEKCTSLQEFDLSFSGNCWGDSFQKICDGLKSSSKYLSKVNLHNCGLTERESVYLGDLLEECNSLQEIDLSSNSKCWRGFERICSGLKCSWKSLHSIHLPFCNLDEEQSFWLGDLLQQCNNIQDISLCYNSNTGSGFEKICKGLKSSSNSLFNLNLYGCQLTEEQSIWLANFLEACHSLKNVNLVYITNSESGFITICDALKSSCNSLSTIAVYLVNLNKEQSVSLGDLLEKCTRLEDINIDYLCNCDDGLSSICNGLTSSSNTLSTIHVENCAFTEEQSVWMGDFLKECHSLKTIIWNNKCHGFKNICNGLKSSSNSLLKIDFRYNLFTEDESYWLGEFLEECTRLESVNLGNCKKFRNGFVKVCLGLKSSSNSLFKLKLNKCSLTDEQCCCLGNLLSECNSLRILHIDNFMCSGSGFRKVLSRQTSLANSLVKFSFKNSLKVEEHFNSVGEFLKECKGLKKADSSYNYSLGKCYSKVFDGLKSSSKSLLKLNLSDCRLTKENSVCLADFLTECCCLEDVYLSHNYNMRDGFEKICDGLVSSSNSLLSLCVLECYFTEAQTNWLRNLLSSCRVLQSVSLGVNVDI
ncbi:unnamed protein product [Dimorphilus gyrociliatus]|uniref:Uncharacterized protein n=1 Tax=Dimorphilus gyrociliatus TaxID=2664684 RepID=A0A7I8V7P8_9ANNE|nr:unnamed protein product [Dimorphilus gyrociliatus]